MTKKKKVGKPRMKVIKDAGVENETKEDNKRVGRPNKRESPEQLQKLIDNYFKSISITGACFDLKAIPLNEKTDYEVVRKFYKLESVDDSDDEDGEQKTKRVRYKEIKIPILNDLGEQTYNIRRLEEPTITGLAIYLGTTRDVLLDYQHKDEFSHTIKRGKIMIEHFYEMRLVRDGGSGSIFALKNFGRKDNRSIDFKDKTDDSENTDPEEMTPEQLKKFIRDSEEKKKSLTKKK